MATSNNNNYSVLPIYGSIDEQDHRKSYAYGDVYPLNALVNTVLPFQIDIGTDPTSPTEVFLVNFNDSTETDITAEMTATGLRAYVLGTYRLIVYPSTMPLITAFEQGRYFLRIVAHLSDGDKEFYSEVFTWVPSVDAFLKVEWYDKDNLLLDDGVAVYKTPLYRIRHYLYINAELGKPEYKFEEEGESRDGYFFPEKQISEKVYRFTFTAPEYLCDLMRFIRLSDYVYVYDQYGRQYKADTFLMTPKWLTQGNLAQVDCEFETNTVAKKTGRSVSAEEIGGDFNDDYNNDYNNQGA